MDQISLMKLISLLIPAVLIIAVSCKKNSYTTKPQISIKEITSTVDSGGNLNVTFKFTDKEGDLGGGSIISLRTRLNQDPVTNPTADTVGNPIPSFPNYTMGEFDWTLQYQNLNESIHENDTIYFRYVVTDRAGNTSDTLKSPNIVVLYH
jgi:hypothetical protein